MENFALQRLFRLGSGLAAFATLFILSGCEPDFPQPTPGVGEARETSVWSSYGGSGGKKYAALEQITKSRVGDLEVAWVHRTGDIADVFQMTPILVAGQLVGCSIYNKVFALDPLTGAEIWQYDPAIDVDGDYANNLNCRGVVSWGEANTAICSQRIFTATNDARLIALDAKDGQPCTDFGEQGQLDLGLGVGKLKWQGEYQVTSPPAVIGNVVVVGSAISDNNRVDAPSGVVRGYDARTGKLVWAFDLAPPDFDYKNGLVSDHGYALGTPNVWSMISIDEARDLVFLPTGNPAPDYYRSGAQAELSHYGSSIIALRGSTGEVVWHFSTVLNDFWDFDVPSQPVLADITLEGSTVPVVIQSTKMGFIFVLHRETGEPVVNIEYNQVPRFGPLEAQLSPVQPFPPKAFQVSRDYEAQNSLLGLCDEMDANSVIGAIYTPITQDWTIGLPSNMGATNWGGVAVDAEHGLIAVRTSNVPFRTKLIPRTTGGDLYVRMRTRALSEGERQSAKDALYKKFDLPQDTEIGPQFGTDYLMARHAYLDPTLGVPCAGLPLGEVMVIDIAAQEQRWRKPHGTVSDIVPVPLPIETGMVGVGGPMVTAAGLMFVAGIEERVIRAYDMDSGEELWQHRLPFPGNATPMSYSVFVEGQEKQFVVIAAGGDKRAGSGIVGDYLIAFSLPD